MRGMKVGKWNGAEMRDCMGKKGKQTNKKANKQKKDARNVGGKRVREG